jgi:3D (Asp-Asp-Asp) domain-containing protein
MMFITFVCFVLLFLMITVGSCSATSLKLQIEVQEPVEEFLTIEESLVVFEEPVHEVECEATVVEKIDTESESVPEIKPEQAVEDIQVTIEDNSQEALLAKANRIDNVKITHYCAEKYHHICNAGHPYKTARGHDVVPGYTCAVDPIVIPLGSTVFIDFGDGVIHEYVADDTGGAIKGNRVDLAVATHQYAKECGVKTATVWWVKE